MLLALDWAGGDYAWPSATVLAPLTIGIVLLVLFSLYGKSTPLPVEGLTEEH